MTNDSNSGRDRDEAQQTEWTDELPISGRAESNIADEFDSVDELVEAYRQAEDLTDISYVGKATMRDLREFIHDRDPDAEEVRTENDEGICTEFTTDHGIDDTDDDEFYWAFICPRCAEKNPLKGEPSGFGGRPYGCSSCGWVSLLESGAVNDFAAKATDSAEVPADD